MYSDASLNSRGLPLWKPVTGIIPQSVKVP